MKNSKYFPFERNRYFYGKLLTVDDFLLEQQYGSNKRRLANRFLQGTGVVAGLYVLTVDEKTISIEAGIALDSMGREIVVDTPVVKKLELIEGFSNYMEEGNKNYVYLCIDYDETMEGAVHNIADDEASGEGEKNYGRIMENYRLGLTGLEPEYPILDESSLYEQCRVIYLMEGVSIKQYIPRYAPAGGKIPLRIEVENTGRQYLSFSYEIWLDCLFYEKKSTFTVNFDETQHEKTGSYTFFYELECINSTGVTGSVTLQKNSVHIFMDETDLSFESERLSNEIFISDEDIRNLVIKNYYQNAMDDILSHGQNNRIYLAKLYMLNVGESYMIDRVLNVPFNQYVLNQNLSSALHRMSIDSSLSSSGKSALTVDGSGEERKKDGDKKIRVAKGIYRLALNGRRERGERYISGEIIHGLGLGRVSIQLGSEEEGAVTLWGSSEVFETEGPMIELAALAYPENGTFQIGGRLLEKTSRDEINIHWFAVMEEEEKLPEKIVKKIFIRPGTLELRIRESCHMDVSCLNMADKSIEWQVEERGGEINGDGLYTAPGTPGVYEITAKSTAYPEVKSSVYAVVTE